MFYLMNKDKIIATFDIKPKTEFSESNIFEQKEVLGVLPYGYSDINSWIDGRKASKHNNHLQDIMKKLGCDTNEGFIKLTHATSINDTFWFKRDRERLSWKQVSLYSNEFTEVISKLAFEGVGLYDTVFSSTSPELTCDGSYRKCFRKEDELGQYGNNIFLYKRGGELTGGLETYCEVLASEILRIISPSNSVYYELTRLHDRLASKCNIFTDEQMGYASFSKIINRKSFSLQDVFDFYEKLGSEQELREMLVMDSICFNQDRHAGNYGVLFDNDSLEVKRIAPIFDLNLSLLPFARIDDFNEIGDYLYKCGMKLGEDFTRVGQMALNDKLRDKVKLLCDFQFSFRGDDKFEKQRVLFLEQIINKQAKALLSKEELHTKDVFISKSANKKESMNEKVGNASLLYYQFSELLDTLNLDECIIISECVSSDTVQCYIEKDDFMMNIDFLNKKIIFSDNMKEISFKKICSLDENFGNECLFVKSKLNDFLIKNKIKLFSEKSTKNKSTKKTI